MARKKSPVVRTYDDPELCITHPDGSTTKLIVLAENERIPTLLSTNYDHHYIGPSLVYEQNGPNSRVCDEYHVNDKKTWEWIGRLIADGLSSGTRVTSKIQPKDRHAVKQGD